MALTCAARAINAASMLSAIAWKLGQLRALMRVHRPCDTCGQRGQPGKGEETRIKSKYQSYKTATFDTINRIAAQRQGSSFLGQFIAQEGIASRVTHITETGTAATYECIPRQLSPRPSI